MVDFNEILDAEIDPDSPGTQSLFERLRDNPIAMITGGPGAPRATSKIVTPGGSEKDGVFNDAVTLTLPGFYDFTNIELTADNSTPWISKIRVNGDVNIATGKVLRCVRPNSIGADEADIMRLYNAIFGGNSITGVTDTGGGGGVIGAGGRSRASASIGGTAAIRGGALSNSYHSFMLRRLLIGGSAEAATGGPTLGGGGGGALVMMVNGDMNNDGTIDCSGANGINGGSTAGGGGGGGGLIIVCNGTIDGGTYLAKGGDGANSGSQCGGGGGGGLVMLIAKAFTGTQTKTVTGGTISGGSAPAVAGAAGLAMANITLSEEIINSIMLGAVA